MAEVVTPPILIPESFSLHDGLYAAGRCHAADTRQKTKDHCVFFDLLASADSEAYHCTMVYYTTKFSGFHLNDSFILCFYKGRYPSH
jgi:hypothetical protein